MRATRRGVLAGALAVPAVAGWPQAAFARGTGAVLLLHDPALENARRLAAMHDGEALAIEGDRIRFARAVFARRPSLVLGASRHADAFLIEDVGREAGYMSVSKGVEAFHETLLGIQARDRGAVLSWILVPRS